MRGVIADVSHTEVPLAGDRIGGAREHEHHRSSRISFENMNIIASLTLMKDREGPVGTLVTFRVCGAPLLRLVLAVRWEGVNPWTAGRPISCRSIPHGKKMRPRSSHPSSPFASSGSSVGQ
jgi:hypothetical protein